MADIEKEFWARVDRTGECWEWVGSKFVSGYGRLKFKKKTYRAHRLAFLFAFEDPKDLLVCHHCDNPSCVRPEHLFLGDAKDNARDRDKKGRASKGDRHYCSKLSYEKVERARVLKSSGLSESEIARKFGVSQTAIWKALSGRSWNRA